VALSPPAAPLLRRASGNFTQILQKLCAATKGKLRGSGMIDGAVHSHLPFYLHKELTDVLAQLGENESLGRWSDFIKPEETNFEALRRLSRLYIHGGGDWLSRRHIRRWRYQDACIL
jgi:hypothetical protein